MVESTKNAGKAADEPAADDLIVQVANGFLRIPAARIDEFRMSDEAVGAMLARGGSAPGNPAAPPCAPGMAAVAPGAGVQFVPVMVPVQHMPMPMQVPPSMMHGAAMGFMPGQFAPMGPYWPYGGF